RQDLPRFIVDLPRAAARSVGDFVKLQSLIFDLPTALTERLITKRKLFLTSLAMIKLLTGVSKNLLLFQAAALPGYTLLKETNVKMVTTIATFLIGEALPGMYKSRYGVQMYGSLTAIILSTAMFQAAMLSS
ncbi:MAG: hypothetical protein GY771_03495, partial [bacterium]|nr:hypothetical protein [bacterium]